RELQTARQRENAEEEHHPEGEFGELRQRHRIRTDVFENVHRPRTESAPAMPAPLRDRPSICLENHNSIAMLTARREKPHKPMTSSHVFRRVGYFAKSRLSRVISRSIARG